MLPARKRRLLDDEPPSHVCLQAGIDITTSPASTRIAYPGVHTPPYAVLDRAALQARLRVDLPSNGPVDGCHNVGTKGACWVTGPVFSVHHAHAGTHADQPPHWGDPLQGGRFDGRAYSGAATLLDLADVCAKRSAIGARDLTDAAARTSLDLQAVRRLLLRTYRALPSGWHDDFPHLTLAAAQLLSELPQLVLLGIDTPSVDAMTAAPIVEMAHGALYAGHVALLEGLNFVALGPLPRTDGVIDTLFNPMQDHVDARGAIVRFFPRAV